MKNTENSTMINGNRRGSRPPGSRNRALLEIQRIGEENLITLYQMHIDAALNGDSEAREFILNKGIPSAKPGRMITLPLPLMDTIKNIKEAQIQIFKSMSEGEISIDEGEKLMNLSEFSRKTIETEQILNNINDINLRMKEAGI